MSKPNPVLRAIHDRLAAIEREQQALEQERASLDRLLTMQPKAKERKKKASGQAAA